MNPFGLISRAPKHASEIQWCFTALEPFRLDKHEGVWVWQAWAFEAWEAAWSPMGWLITFGLQWSYENKQPLQSSIHLDTHWPGIDLQRTTETKVFGQSFFPPWCWYCKEMADMSCTSFCILHFIHWIAGAPCAFCQCGQLWPPLGHFALAQRSIASPRQSYVGAACLGSLSVSQGNLQGFSNAPHWPCTPGQGLYRTSQYDFWRWSKPFLCHSGVASSLGNLPLELDKIQTASGELLRQLLIRKQQHHPNDSSLHLNFE